MRKSHLKPEAEMLYLQGNTYEQISTVLGVSIQTLSKWAQECDWRQKREQMQRQPLAISAKISQAFSHEFDRVLSEGFNTKNADILCKIASMQSRMGGIDDFPSSAVIVMTVFTKFVIAHPELSPDEKNTIFETTQEFLHDVKEREFGRQR
ncbi:MAG: hypothetical protein GTN43_02935 [Candidatus Aenigmarchaeota archaeon]|nr:hypothetical protein [Candidatus Aenigmarchaeota archaeon]